MIRLGKLFYPNEFGGIITGVKAENIWIVVDIEVPIQFESKKSDFIRYPESLNDYLREIYSESASKIEYLGEWHTHPDGRTSFSIQDLKSMQEIAINPNVRNKNPLLMILSIGKDIKYQLYTFNNGKLLKL